MPVRMWKLNLSYLTHGNVKWYSHSEMHSFLAYDPAIAFSGMHPKEIKTYANTNTCTQMLQKCYL